MTLRDLVDAKSGGGMRPGDHWPGAAIRATVASAGRDCRAYPRGPSGGPASAPVGRIRRASMRLFLASQLMLACAGGAGAQQAVRLPLAPGDTPGAISATVFRPASRAPAPAVAIFHGCGGVGVNLTGMARHLASLGNVVLVVDSFGARGIRNACTRHWPTLAQARDRTRDVDAAVAWLAAQGFVTPDRIAVMGYSYGGGVVLMWLLQHPADERQRPGSRQATVRAAIAVYPDCGLLDGGGALAVRQPLLLAMAELDDWTPVRQCEAMLRRVGQGHDGIESRVYPGAHHSFDAVGLPLTWLATAGNRSKPNDCCGAHYGYHAPAHAQFLRDIEAFVGRHLRDAQQRQ